MDEYQNILITRPSVLVRTLADYIALAKSRPGKINYATAGVGRAGHMAMELLRSMTHIDVTHVPYKGGGSAINDLILEARGIDAFTANPDEFGAYMRSGRAKWMKVVKAAGIVL